MSKKGIFHDPDKPQKLKKFSDMSPAEYKKFQKAYKVEIAKLPSPFFDEVMGGITLKGLNTD